MKTITNYDDYFKDSINKFVGYKAKKHNEVYFNDCDYPDVMELNISLEVKNEYMSMRILGHTEENEEIDRTLEMDYDDLKLVMKPIVMELMDFKETLKCFTIYEGLLYLSHFVEHRAVDEKLAHFVVRNYQNDPTLNPLNKLLNVPVQSQVS